MPNRIVALGFFDGVHLGHCALLRHAAEKAAELGVQAAAITFDPHPDVLLKGEAQKLLTTTDERLDLMQRKCSVPELLLLPFDEAMRNMRPEAFVRDILAKQLQAIHVVCGETFRFGHRGEGTAAQLQTLCAALGIGCSVIAPVTLDGEIVSSTRIRTLLQKGDMERVNALLGHPYCMTGEVIHGQALGHALGFPTANFAFPEELLAPRFGVYIGLANLGEECYPTVTNLGLRPTVGGTAISVESWLLGFDGDLYGQRFRLDLLRFLRPEQKFSSLEELQQQIFRDRDQALDYFSI